MTRRWPVLPKITADEIAVASDAVCTAAEWRETKNGRRLVLVLSLNRGGVSGWVREYWPPPGSCQILKRVLGSLDPEQWPDAFPLPLMIARNIRNPKTGERKDRVWIVPADLWPSRGMSAGSVA
jgi:hypothetical protein